MRGSSSVDQRGSPGWCFITLFLQWTNAWKGLSRWAILALTNRTILMSSICKKTTQKKNWRGGTESVIREIKSYVYTVMAHVLWSWTKCGGFQGKQTACPGTRLCLFQLLSLESPKQTRALQMIVQLKAAFRLFLLCQIAGILCLISTEVFNRNLSVALMVVRAAVLPCSYMFKRGWSLYIFF